MKHSRRQELKTNELSIYLQQVYDFLTRNATYVIGGVVVVALIIVVGTMNTRSQHRAKVDAADRIKVIQSGEVVRDAKLLDEIKDLAATYGTDPGLGPELLDMEATLAHQLALNLTTAADKGRRESLLKEAMAACEKAISDFPDRPEVVARARLIAAGVEETLLTDGQGDRERIRKLYKQVIDGPVNPFQQLAQEQLDSLDKRTAKLEVVATRPTESAPAVTTRPAAIVKPVVEPMTLELPGPKSATVTTKPADAPKPAAKAPPAAKSGTTAKPPAGSKSTAKPTTKPAK
jgi:hypothetical protein